MLHFWGEGVHFNQFLPLFLDADRVAANLFHTLIYLLLIAEADLGVEEILDNLVNVMVLAFFLVELFSNVQSFGFQGCIGLFVGLFEFFGGGDVFGFGLGFSSFE